MLTPGLVSVTFRQLAPEEIIALVRQAGLAAIEWGGDVHVPHGDLARARQVGRLTREAGLQVSSYGSYYRVGHVEPCPFEAVLDSALELGAPTIRVWAGKVGSRAAGEDGWQQVIADSRRISALAARAGLSVAYEFHGHTLTDTPAAARRLLESVDHPALRCYWQPPQGATFANALQGLTTIQPWLSNLHIFQWQVNGDPPQVDRRPLAEGASVWPEYLRQADQAGSSRFALLEFVRGDDPRQFLQDANVLCGWLKYSNDIDKYTHFADKTTLGGGE
jgi:sugar phosphate isomerase/epimerase